MVTNSKVLTVSYGTFSCTLEGFDDSFDTMKSIAEYFRDLAADDRYFGAEPPTPDAEMLARIAEREIARRVQVRTDQGAIVLSAAQDTAEAPAPVKEPAPEAETTPTDAPVTAVTEDAIEDVASDTASDDITQPPETDDTQEAADTDEVAPEAEAAEPEVEDVTDAILEAVTAPDEAGAAEDTPVVEEAKSPAPAEDDMSDDAVSNLVADLAMEDAMAATAPENTAEVEIVAGDIAAETEVDLTRIAAALDDTAVEDAEEFEIAAEAEAETASEILAPETAEEDPQFDEDSIAAKLRRIRAVVSRVEALPEDEDFSEDEHADNVMGDVQDREENADVLTLVDPIAPVDVAVDLPEDEEEVTPVQPRARILRMKKADFEEAKARGQLLEAEPVEDDEEDAPEILPEAPAPSSSLTPEDEADLLAELAAVEAELKGEPVEPAATEVAIEADSLDAIETPVEVDAPEQPLRKPRLEHLAEASPTSEEGVSRLLAEADQQFDEPEGSRRRSAIAHLRAAVAATKAEKGLAKSDEDDSSAYRDDLASVVQPLQRASDPEPVTEAPAKPARPRAPATATAAREATPLKLVAEQRIDAPESPAQTDRTRRDPVRPRRVSSADRMERPAAAPAAPVGAPEDADSFGAFVEQTGARSLHDILEAAAAYLTFVEGHPRFSRPMVMRLARDLDEDNFNREDSLRGFGQLLRDNKIEKLEGGRFTASDRIRYKPDDRAVG
ncbi:hypothetical protein [Shimia sp. SDUM112013]|uniref:hypothetical protein n=1 Tax=Shimia sp. SDUM112013 TaxID=3136160 RepID=UPI0032EE0649